MLVFTIVTKNNEDFHEAINSISAVSIELPSFWKEYPDTWFKRAEAQFTLAGITTEITKFSHILVALDPEAIRIVTDLVTNPPTNPYSALKEALGTRLSASETSKLNQLLTNLTLGDRQASQLLREMQQLSGDKVGSELLRTLWRQRLHYATK